MSDIWFDEIVPSRSLFFYLNFKELYKYRDLLSLLRETLLLVYKQTI